MSNNEIFSFKEAISQGYRRALTDHIKIDENTAKEAILIRLLLGTIDIVFSNDNTVIKQKNNYSNLGIVRNARISTKPIKDYLYPDFNLNELDAYFASHKYDNYSFNNELIIEYCWYFYRKSKGEETLAFLHLYRILEYVSYTFPLMYTSISRDYDGSYDSLKKYFSDSKSQLKFFQVFLDKIFDGQLILNTQLTLNFSQNPENSSARWNVYKNYLQQKIMSEVRDEKLEIKYKDLLDLCITLRNRFFHFAVGGENNIKTSQIGNPDDFFQVINEEALNWISFIYLEIFKVTLQKL